MKRFLSFGAGVNSVALYILLRERGVDFEAVYADHGADWPETRQYVRWMIENGHPVTVLQTRREGLTLYDYYWKHKCIPLRVLRHCTEHFKVRPLRAYFLENSPDDGCVVYLAIDAGEVHRARHVQVGKMRYEYPLVEWGIDREGCLEIIRRARWPLPRKSGCFICPFQSMEQWEELARLHPDLLEKAAALEERANQALAERGHPTGMYLGDPYPVKVAAAGAYARRLWRAKQRGQLNFWSQPETVEQCPYCML